MAKISERLENLKIKFQITQQKHPFKKWELKLEDPQDISELQRLPSANVPNGIPEQVEMHGFLQMS